MEGRNTQIDSGAVALTYDALERWAEKLSGGNYIQAVYDPAGRRLALMVNGSTLGLARVSLVGDAVADYSSTGLSSYVHPDWLGSTRIKSTPSRTFLNDVAFAPFGEQYVATGSVDAFFTVATHDPEVDLTDFPAREYHATQGRWLTPDPAALGAVDLTNPQSWNRYAYVGNNPLNSIDPTGRHIVDCDWDDCSGLYNGGGGGGGMVVDGVQPTIFNTSGLGSNALAACPNNFCSGFAPVGNGNIAYVQYTAPASGPGSYTALTTPIPDPSLPQNQAYAAYTLDCQHSATPCTGGESVATRCQGLAGNYALGGSTLNSASLTGMIPDPLTGGHGGPSWYDWSLVGTGHVAADQYGQVESHFDTFSPIFLTPLHFLFDVLPSFFVNRAPGITGPTYTCTPGVG